MRLFIFCPILRAESLSIRRFCFITLEERGRRKRADLVRKLRIMREEKNERKEKSEKRKSTCYFIFLG